MGLDVAPGSFTEPHRMASLGLRVLASQQLPTWNKTVLDRSVKRAIQAADGTRPVIKHSGVLPRLPTLEGTDSHLYFGWYWGDERDLPGFARTLPSQVRFPTEFGAQAVPETDDFVDAEAWPELDWDRLAATHNLRRSEEHTSELQSLMRISYAVFCLFHHGRTTLSHPSARSIYSGVLPRLPTLEGTDSHLYFGWYWGDERDLPGLARTLPSQVRFPTEFGAQAVPETDDFVDAEAWPELDWDRLAATHNLRLALLDRHVPGAAPPYEP